MATGTLSAETAALITQMLLEYTAINRKRELVNNLQEQGITSQLFHELVALSKVVSLDVPLNVQVDVTNGLHHLEKGIETKDDALRRFSVAQVKRVAKRAFDAQEVRRVRGLDQ